MGYEVCEERKIFYSAPKTEEEYMFSSTFVPPHPKIHISRFQTFTLNRAYYIDYLLFFTFPDG
jgi:hypothetical protein